MSPQETPQPDVVLSSLAIIRANFDYGRRSYLDNFVPFALDAVAQGGQPDYSDADAAHAIYYRFGLRIPTRVVASILGRAAREDLGTWDDGRFSLSDKGREAVPKIGRLQATLMREQSALAHGLADFAGRMGTTFTAEDAEEALLAYVEAHAVPLLTHAVRGGTYAGGEPEPAEEPSTRYVVAAFVAHIAGSDQRAFEQLESMVKGSMLAAALYLPATGELDRRFNRTVLYLDTPILIRVLGYDGGEAQAAALDVVRLAQAQGAEVACLEHTATELRGVIDSTIGVLRRNGAADRIRRIDRYFLDCEYTESDVRLLLERVPEDLRRHRVVIVPKPEHVERLGVDEQALEYLLQAKVGYRRRATLLNDLDSITAVHRRRGGESTSRLEECRAVLVTDNWNVSAASREFFKDSRHEWPLVMLDHDLAAILWVKSPTEAPDLPRRQIIADCLAALQPSPQLWQRYVEVIEQLKRRDGFDDGDLALLRYSGEASRTLMDRTQGDAEAVSPAAVEAALEAAKAAAAAPARAEAEHAQGALAEATSTVEGLRGTNAEQAERAESLAKQVGSYETREALQRFRAKERADRTARRLRNGFLAVLSIAVVAGAVLAGLKIGTSLSRTTRVGITVGVLLVVGTALGLVRIVIGGSVREWITPVVTKVSARIEKRHLKELGLQ